MDFIIGLLQFLEGFSGFGYIKEVIKKIHFFENKSALIINVSAFMLTLLLGFIVFVILSNIFL